MDPDQTRLVISIFGGLLILAGLIFVFFRREPGRNKIKVLGQEFELSTPGLVIILAGCGLLLTPYLWQFSPTPSGTGQSQNSASQEESGTDQDRSATQPDTSQAETGPGSCAVATTAKWKVYIHDTRWTQEYAEKYYTDRSVVYPSASDHTLVVMETALENKWNEAISLVLTERRPGNTGVITSNGSSYSPVTFDTRQAGSKMITYESSSVLPGAKKKLNLVFSLPKNEQLETLVLALNEYPSGPKTNVTIPLSDC